MVSLPQIKTRRRTERVLDTRMCLINQCPFLTRGIDRGDGQTRFSCGAGVFRAQLPAEPLKQYIIENPEPIPGFQADTNPFLLRLLMARECLRPECGVCEIEYTEKVLEIDPDELKAGLFS